VTNRERANIDVQNEHNAKLSGRDNAKPQLKHYDYFIETSHISVIYSRIDLHCKNEQTNKYHRPYNPEGKGGIPAITYVVLLHPRQRRHGRARLFVSIDIGIATVVNMTLPKKLDPRVHRPRYVQNEQHEADHHQYARGEIAVIGEDEEDDDEEDCESPDCYAVREEPWYTQSHLVLNCDKLGEYTNEDGGGDDHEEDPEVELGLGPAEGCPSLGVW